MEIKGDDEVKESLNWARFNVNKYEIVLFMHNSLKLNMQECTTGTELSIRHMVVDIDINKDESYQMIVCAESADVAQANKLDVRTNKHSSC